MCPLVTLEGLVELARLHMCHAEVVEDHAGRGRVADGLGGVERTPVRPQPGLEKPVTEEERPENERELPAPPVRAVLTGQLHDTGQRRPLGPQPPERAVGVVERDGLRPGTVHRRPEPVRFGQLVRGDQQPSGVVHQPVDRGFPVRHLDFRQRVPGREGAHQVVQLDETVRVERDQMSVVQAVEEHVHLPRPGSGQRLDRGDVDRRGRMQCQQTEEPALVRRQRVVRDGEGSGHAALAVVERGQPGGLRGEPVVQTPAAPAARDQASRRDPDGQRQQPAQLDDLGRQPRPPASR